MPVCIPGSLPGFVGTVTTVAGRGSPAEWRSLSSASEIPCLVDSPPPRASPGAKSGWMNLPLGRRIAGQAVHENPPLGWSVLRTSDYAAGVPPICWGSSDARRRF
jgi:hypothetical protein